MSVGRLLESSRIFGISGAALIEGRAGSQWHRTMPAFLPACQECLPAESEVRIMAALASNLGDSCARAPTSIRIPRALSEEFRGVDGETLPCPRPEKHC